MKVLLFLALCSFSYAADDKLIERIAAGQVELSGLTSYQHEQLIQTLARRLILAEQKIVALEARLSDAGDRSSGQEDRIREIQKAYDQIRNLHSALRIDDVRTQMRVIEATYPELDGSQAYKKFSAEIAVIGRPAPEPVVAEWFQGETRLTEAEVSLLVFWETWCPHCQDEMPRLQALYERYRDKGLQIIGLTRMTNEVTVSDVIGFIANNDLTFAVAKSDDEGTMDAYGVSGVPAAALVRDNKIIWRGNPERITDLTIARALAENR